MTELTAPALLGKGNAGPLPPAAPAKPETPPRVLAFMSRPFWFGLAVLVLFFGVLGSWAALAPLSAGAVAPGIVSPDSDRKVIQHLEGGIIKTIHVHEGQHVSQGDLLVSLEPTQAQASYSANHGKWLRLLVSRARALAQSTGADTLALPAEASNDTSAEMTAFIDGQQQLFSARRTAQLQQEDIYGQQIRQLEAQIAAIQADADGQAAQLGLIDQQLADAQKLRDQQLLAKSVVLDLQRQRAQLQSSIASNAANTARANQSIEEVRLSLLQAREKYRADAATEASQINNDIAQIEEQMTAAGDVLRRTEIVSPVDGVVLNLRNQTPGGIIRAGEPIMDIVPLGEEMVVVARLSPKDIDAVHIGLPARVTLVPFSTRNSLPLNGEVTEVAADTTVDEATHQSYFEIRVKVPVEELAAHHGFYMSPGMPADVTVVTGERTMLEYLIDPFIKSIRDAFTST